MSMPARARILIIATGGTIASTAEGAAGLAPTRGGHELVAQVPQLEELCELDVVQPMNIDSTNMRPSDWLRIAHEVEKNYDSYDGFVVLHGTDTMAYSAAALSYLVQHSPKPIVLTGSQQPMANPFTDAKLNLYQAVLYACDAGSSDVSVVFGGRVICGTRARKQRTMSFNAFTSLNFPTLASIRSNRVIRSAQAAPAKVVASPQFYHQLNERVFVLRLTPALNPAILQLLRPHYDAVVIETFGIGGIPEHDDASFEAALDAWCASGGIAIITTQVPEEGLDLGVYEVGRAYQNKRGVLAAGDMSTEALVAKTMWALGHAQDQDELARLFLQPVNHDRTDF